MERSRMLVFASAALFLFGFAFSQQQTESSWEKSWIASAPRRVRTR